MKVLFVSSEAYPFIKTGGLGDVAYALPKALKKLGVDVRIIIPKYNNISPIYKSCMKTISTFNVQLGWRNQYCGLEYLEYDDIPYYFIDNEYYFKRNSAYGFLDEEERFSYFSKAVLEAINYIDDFAPDIIHCNDWHCGIIPVLLKDHYQDKTHYENNTDYNNSKYSNIKTVFTIHNLRYQGIFSKDILGDLLSLSDDYFDEDKLKYYDGISFMKGGLNYCDYITTVSNSYAEEITTQFYGEGLDGILSCKKDILKGIVNGIDYTLFDPNTDKEISFNYDYSTLQNKIKNKLELQKELNLPVSEKIPMIGIVTRLVNQKGLDLIAGVIEELLSFPIQIVILGTGDSSYEDLFKYYSSIYPSILSSNIYFDDTLARKIYASSDMFLMPSLFEPCGIGQLLALRYGSLPIVRETGGLKDTVIPYNEYTNEGDGFCFTNYNAHEMLFTIKTAIEIYKNKKIWSNLIKNAMTKDTSWQSSAACYKKIYFDLSE